MSSTVIRLYDSFANAENARNALLKSGFTASGIHFTSNNDEAGPVEGNFTVGNGNEKDPSYAANYADTGQRSAYMITVDAADEAQHKLASGILDKFGAVSI